MEVAVLLDGAVGMLFLNFHDRTLLIQLIYVLLEFIQLVFVIEIEQHQNGSVCPLLSVRGWKS